MEEGTSGSGGAAYDLPSNTPAAAVSRWSFAASTHYQHLLDKSTPHVLRRWIAFFVIAIIYIVRVYLVEGFYVVSYALGIYILNLLIGFLSPQVDPEFQYISDDGPTLPTRGSDEFRPFVRRLPEFKFWLYDCQFFCCLCEIELDFFLWQRYSITKAFCIAFVMTFFSVFDVPVFWPILLFYWLLLFMLTMRKQILHMMKYKYVPFSFGKQRYNKKTEPSADNEDLLPMFSCSALNEDVLVAEILLRMDSCNPMIVLFFEFSPVKLPPSHWNFQLGGGKNVANILSFFFCIEARRYACTLMKFDPTLQTFCTIRLLGSARQVASFNSRTP
ncbi:unnamed protein product [Ilex paraguariensis]|uniref:Protein RER1 n=1 Tax=Ilex paraguariensis TaxID=185542 RepID=A0ABC8QRG4_9AQUA